MNPKEYLKAIIAAVGTGLTALGASAEDGLTLAEVLITLGGVLASFGITYAIPNKTPTEVEKVEGM